MIIFDLDGTLADCEHRRHFVVDKREIAQFNESHLIGDKFKPNWQAFYEACDKDPIIKPVQDLFISLWNSYHYQIQIWSGRCESVRIKTERWMTDNGLPCGSFLKMRPIGDNTPDEILKERWLDEAIAEGKTIDMVFDDRKKVINFWLRRGIFVFDVSQGKGDF